MRPPIHEICYIDSGGNPAEFIVGCAGITEIKETMENGESCVIPWVEVWAQDKLIARFCQHKLERIFY